MPVFSRQDIPDFLKKHQGGEIFPVYLLIGDRFLCHDVAEEIIHAVFPDTAKRQTQVRTIDGDEEDALDTLNLLRTYSLFSQRQIIKVTDTKLFHVRGTAKNSWQRAKKLYNAGERQEAELELSRFLGHACAEVVKSNQDLIDMPPSQWQAAFSFNKPADLSWLKEISFQRANLVSIPSQEEGLTNQYAAAFKNGIPTDNLLMLLANAVDKRNAFFKYVKEYGAVIDLSVDTGFSASARREQQQVLKELISNTLSSFKKRIHPRAEEELLARVGFHPVAITMETEKLALYAEDEEILTLHHVEQLIGRTREDALFELNEAFFSRDVEQTLAIANRLLETGVHPLAIVASLRNQVRKLLLFRSFLQLDHPAYRADFSYALFQKYLEELKTLKTNSSSMLSGHPYSLYQIFKRAERFSQNLLRDSLTRLLSADYHLKGSSVGDVGVLHDFIFWFFSVD